ncbi:MAG: UDP-3-O-(3-hydroxymyristoyl)glucosamine N-acyltransferase [Candidatus Sumerlaeaceae bacterium]|nr:UDP-3-O-(3-hydroxymyristoyl)glucosamine N-acyltransferase [Candidatus Sumerlaeaceae bacterium]
MRLSEFAAAVNGELVNFKEDFEITGISTLQDAKPGQVSFAASERYLQRALETEASAIIVPKGFSLGEKTCVVLDEPWRGVLFLLEYFYPHDAAIYFKGVDPSAVVAENVRLGQNVRIGPKVVIGPNTVIGDETVIEAGCIIGPNVEIGSRCHLHAHVVIEHGTRIGHRVIIQAGAVIGGDGFKFELIGGKWRKIPQVGCVVIEDDVEIGANTTIDRASFTETRIGAGTKIDNLVQIAHNVTIGKDCVIVAQVGIAGSSSVGDGSILAAQVGVADNLQLGKRVRVMARSGVKDNIEDGATVLGTPARPFRVAARIVATEAKLPEMLAEVTRLSEKVRQLEARLAELENSRSR